MDCAGQGCGCHQESRVIKNARMSEADKIKNVIIQNMQKLCVHCANGDVEHNCPLRQISQQVSNIRGVPVMVNAEFRGIIIAA